MTIPNEPVSLPYLRPIESCLDHVYIKMYCMIYTQSTSNQSNVPAVNIA